MSNNDIETLKKIAHETPTAERVFTFFALRQRHRGSLNLAKIKRGLRRAGESIDEVDFAAIFKKLRDAGYGRFEKGTSRFATNHPVYQLGAAALGQKVVQLKPVTKSRRKTTLEQITKAIDKMPAPMPGLRRAAVSVPAKVVKTLVYCLVNGVNAKIELEGEVSPDAIDSIMKSLKSKSA